MRKIGDILLDRGLITKEQLDEALKKQNTSKKYLGQILIEMGVITEDVLTDIQASILGLNVISTNSLKIHPKIIQFIPKNIAVKYRLVPIYIEPNNKKNTLCMVTSEEPPSAIISKMSEKLNIPIKLFLTTYSELDDLLVKHYDKKREEPILSTKEESKKDIVSNVRENESSKPKNNFNLEFKDELKDDILISDVDEEPILSGNLIEDDETILSGDLIEDENVLAGSLIDNNVESTELKKKNDLSSLNLNDEKTLDIENDSEKLEEVDNSSLDLFDDLELSEDIIPQKVSDDIVLDLFEDSIEESIEEESGKSEKENNEPINVQTEGIKLNNVESNNIPTLSINHDLDESSSVKPNLEEEKKEKKKLNFLEAFKSEDDSLGDELIEDNDVDEIDVEELEEFDEEIEEVEVFSKSEEEVYVNVDLDLDEEEDDELKDISLDDKPKDNDDFPFVLDDLMDKKDESKKNLKTKPILKSPPPLNSNDNNNKKNNDPQNVDKSGFPSPKIKEFKENSDDETNPGTTQKISLSEKKESEEWLKNNKNRVIPDLDSIFNSNDVLDPLNNKNIDKILLSKRLQNLPNKLMEFLKTQKLKNNKMNDFKDFFDNLENNPNNIIMLSMLELLLLGDKPNLDLFFDIILKNINNVNPRNK